MSKTPTTDKGAAERSVEATGFADTVLLTKIIRGGPNLLHEAVASGVTPARFLHDEDGALFEWMSRYADDHGKTPTAERVREQYPKFIPDKGSDGPFSDAIDQWRKACAYRTYVTLARDIAKTASNPNRDQIFSVQDIARRALEDVDALTTTNGRAEMVSATTIDATAVRWLWHGFIPDHALTVIAADPKVGKGLLSVWLAAQVTRGWRGWATRSVAFLGHEDSMGILKARLDASGADPERVYFLRGRNNTILTLPTDADTIRKQIVDNNIGILFIDPVNSHMDAKLKTGDDKDIRTALSPLALIAQDTGCIIVVIHHFSKGSIGGKLLYRFSGSAAYVGVARSVLALGRKTIEGNGSGAESDGSVASVLQAYTDDAEDEDDDPNARFLFQTGSNYSEDKPPIRFQIEEVEVEVTDGVDDVARFIYVGEDHDIRQEQVFSNGMPRGQGRPKDETIRAWIEEQIGDRDEVPAQELYDAAHADGHSDRTVRAILRREMGWQSVRTGRSYVWRRPTAQVLKLVPITSEDDDE
jgi:AAA domain